MFSRLNENEKEDSNERLRQKERNETDQNRKLSKKIESVMENSTEAFEYVIKF